MSADQNRSRPRADRIWRLLWQCMVLPWGYPSDRRFGKLLPCLYRYQKVRYLISYPEKEYSPSSFSLFGETSNYSTKYFF